MYVKSPLWEILAFWRRVGREYEDSKDRPFEVSGRDSSQLLAVLYWKSAPQAAATVTIQ